MLDFDTPAAAPPPTDPLTIGNAMHSYLALVDLDRPDVDTELLGSITETDEIREMATRYHSSAMARRLGNATRVSREIPLSFVDDGAIVHGVIDALLEEPDGSATIVDWKTDRVDADEAPERAEEYRAQLTTYARGVQLAFGLDEPPRTVVHFLRGDDTIEL